VQTSIPQVRKKGGELYNVESRPRVRQGPAKVKSSCLPEHSGDGLSTGPSLPTLLPARSVTRNSYHLFADAYCMLSFSCLPAGLPSTPPDELRQSGAWCVSPWPALLPGGPGPPELACPSFPRAAAFLFIAVLGFRAGADALCDLYRTPHLIMCCSRSAWSSCPGGGGLCDGLRASCSPAATWLEVGSPVRRRARPIVADHVHLRALLTIGCSSFCPHTLVGSRLRASVDEARVAPGRGSTDRACLRSRFAVGLRPCRPRFALA